MTYIMDDGYDDVCPSCNGSGLIDVYYNDHDIVEIKCGQCYGTGIDQSEVSKYE